MDEALGSGEDFLDGLRRIGVDEVAYRKGHRYLLCVVDHATGRIVWAHPGRSKATLALFFVALGPERAHLLEAVSVDLHGAWPPVIRTFAPQAAICADPFHVIKLAGEALDALRRADWQRLRREDPERARWFKGTRFLLRRRAEGLSEAERGLIGELEETNARVYRGWLLVEQLRIAEKERTAAYGRPFRWDFSGVPEQADDLDLPLEAGARVRRLGPPRELAKHQGTVEYVAWPTVRMVRWDDGVREYVPVRNLVDLEETVRLPKPSMRRYVRKPEGKRAETERAQRLGEPFLVA